MMDKNDKKQNLLPLGELVRQRIEFLGLTKTIVAERLGISLPLIAKYYDKTSMQSHTIFKLCKELRYNFFADLASELPEEIQNTGWASEKKLNEHQKEIDNLKKEIESLNRQIEDQNKEIAIYKNVISKNF